MEGEIVYRTTYLHELNLVAQTLEETGIPYFRGVVDATGEIYPMPVSSLDVAGSVWVIAVESHDRQKAEQVISDLPVSKDSGSSPIQGLGERQKRLLRYYIWFCLLFAIMVGVAWCLRAD